MRSNYLGWISGPLLDLIDRHVELPQLEFGMSDLNIDARAQDRVLEVARTSADLAGQSGSCPTE